MVLDPHSCCTQGSTLQGTVYLCSPLPWKGLFFFPQGGCVSIHIGPDVPGNPLFFGTLLLLYTDCWKQKVRAFSGPRSCLSWFLSFLLLASLCLIFSFSVHHSFIPSLSPSLSWPPLHTCPFPSPSSSTAASPTLLLSPPFSLLSQLPPRLLAVTSYPLPSAFILHLLHTT